MISLGSTLVAAIAAAILYSQWRTAHQRAIFDLFDARMLVFRHIEEALIAARLFEEISDETYARFMASLSRAKFLFGDDVLSKLKSIQDDVTFCALHSIQLIETQSDKERLLKERRECVIRITIFASNAVEVFAPYMRMDQTLPPPTDWNMGLRRGWFVLSVCWIVYCLWHADPACPWCPFIDMLNGRDPALFLKMVAPLLLGPVLIKAAFWVWEGFARETTHSE